MILFVNAQGSEKIKLTFSKALLLTISSSDIVKHSNGFCRPTGWLYSPARMRNVS